jgi:alkaline phosphatase
MIYKNKFSVKVGLLITGLVIAFCLFSCAERQKIVMDNNDVVKFKTPKYIFFFIGDGMSLPQIRLAEAVLATEGFEEAYFKESGVQLGRDKLYMSGFPASGLATSHANNRFITGSAAAGTALATGNKTTINTISMNDDRSLAQTTMAEMAKAGGKKVGILSSVGLDHATPASFYAHTEDRNNFETIGEQLLGSGVDYFAGGFVRHDTYKNKTYEDYLKMLSDSGYLFVDNREQFNALTNGSGKVFATISGLEVYNGDEMALPYNIDLDLQSSNDQTITLAEFTRKGIELLDNEEGFFMMVEGGKIDWVGHANDVVSNVYETVAFDNAIGEALEFYEQHPDETLIVVTGDHETGGLSIGFAGTSYATYFEKLLKQNISFKLYQDTVRSWAAKGNVTFDDALVSLEESFGLGDTTMGLKLTDYEISRLKSAFNLSMKPRESTIPYEERAVLYSYYDPFTVMATRILANKAGIGWSSFAHTALPLVVLAIGEGHELFNGYYDNTDIAKKIMLAGGYSGEEFFAMPAVDSTLVEQDSLKIAY